jgi:GPH family glycoside/pentoside/hexuronide:cation symporter
MTDTERDSSRLPVVTQAVYGTGQFVDSVSGTVIGTFLFFYLTAVCGLSGSLTGVSLFVALLVDAFVDPFVGSLSDNTTSRWGRRHLYMFASFPLMLIGLGMLFSVPPNLTGWPLFIYVTGMALILRIGLSLFIVPYIALGAELTDDYLVRSHVIAWRSALSVPATIAPIIIGYSVFLSAKGALLDRAAYIPLGWACGAVLCIMGAVAAFGTLGSLGRLHRVVPSGDNALRRLLREVPEVFRNRSFIILFATVLVFFVAQGTAGALGLHGGKYFWMLKQPELQLLGVISALGLLIGIPVVAVLGPYVEKKTMTLWGLAYICIAQAGMPLLRIAGFIPQPLVVPVLAVNNALVFGAVTVVAIAFQSMMADAADEHELLFGARREGVYFSGITFSVKAATGFGSLIAGFAMDLIHFPYAIAAKGGENLHLAPELVRNLGLLYGVAPAAMTLVCIAINALYRIDRHVYADIQRQLTARRAAATAQSPEPVYEPH